MISSCNGRNSVKPKYSLSVERMEAESTVSTMIVQQMRVIADEVSVVCPTRGQIYDAGRFLSSGKRGRGLGGWKRIGTDQTVLLPVDMIHRRPRPSFGHSDRHTDYGNPFCTPISGRYLRSLRHPDPGISC